MFKVEERTVNRSFHKSTLAATKLDYEYGAE
jgi:hypothetical protein